MTAEFEFSNRESMEFSNGHVSDYFSVTYRLDPSVTIDGIEYGTVDVARGFGGPEGSYEFVDIFAADRDETRNNPITYMQAPKYDALPYEEAPEWVKQIKEAAYDRLGVINQV